MKIYWVRPNEDARPYDTGYCSEEFPKTNGHQTRSDLGGEWSFVSHGNGTHTHEALAFDIHPIEQEDNEKVFGMEMKVSAKVPPDEFWLETGDGKRHVFKISKGGG